ncbi:hypothetical protein PGH12_16545 [Chryseobacterium wangxinyae]|nr:hypothetical protein [Chryseobacterium sp. CY350]MCY0977967.1 hypothetical protein [Chryseobacterium sp. CY350]WBZ95054.1 hypothetical protein PGH12_16545 [Chryseobacterium sp. CY350]
MNKRILITGAASGFGKLAAFDLAKKRTQSNCYGTSVSANE